MSPPPGAGVRIRELTATEARACIPDLSATLIDCVEGGAGVSFMAPLTRERADAFWHDVADGVAAGNRRLLVAEDPAGALVGTAQVVFAWPENAPHRAEVVKVLVRRSARRGGSRAGSCGRPRRSRALPAVPCWCWTP